MRITKKNEKKKGYKEFLGTHAITEDEPGRRGVSEFRRKRRLGILGRVRVLRQLE
jgi:hypothetical protein